MRLSIIITAAPLALLAACTDNAEPANERVTMDAAGSDIDDPGSMGAEGGTAFSAIDTSPEAVAAARSRAMQMVGGEDALRRPGAPRELSATDSVTPAMQQAARAAVSPGGQDCAAKVGYTTAWAGKLPGAFPVYPRASTQEAAGTDEGACSLRIVTFRTPVPLDDVLSFYATRADAAGFDAEHVRVGGDNILSGTKGDSAYVVYGRALAGGMTEIDLVTSMQ